MNHIGAISGGKDSVAMAVLLTETHPETNFTWVCTPTGNESRSGSSICARCASALAQSCLL